MVYFKPEISEPSDLGIFEGCGHLACFVNFRKFPSDEETVMSRKWKTVLILSLLGNLAIVFVAIKTLEYRAHINEYLDKYTYVVREFSRRNEYSGDNRFLVSDTVVYKRLVFFGTQLTKDWDLRKFFPGYEAINRGVKGQRLPGLLLRFRPDVIELKPGAVIIESASFDFRHQNTVREMEDYVACMAELARFHGIVPLPTTVIPPVKGAIELKDYSLLDSLAEFNEWLKKYCRENGFIYMDFNGAVADSGGYLAPELSTGQIGLNDEGYRRITDLTTETLESIK
jgi:lysophospholipase L1-like esterase